MDKMYYPAILHKEKDGGYSIWIQNFNGCISQGESMGEAIENIKEALGLFYEVSIEEKTELPKPATPEKTNLEENETIVIIEFDPFEYLQKQSTKAIKKTLTIPAWLNTMAEKAGINFSQTLQTALKEQLNL